MESSAVRHAQASYQYERAKRLGASQSGIYWALKRLDVTYKKTLIHPKTDEEKCLLFQNKLNTYQANGMGVVYLDESGFAHDMPRTHGDALKGQWCYGTQDWDARGRSNVIGALLGERLLTVTLFQDTINTATFEAWLAQDLLPQLNRQGPLLLWIATLNSDYLKKVIDF